MSNDQVMNDLKQKRLPTFGTAYERKERLKKHYGVGSGVESNTSQSMNGASGSAVSGSTVATGNGVGSAGTATQTIKKSSCLEEIEKLKIQREERRRRMDDIKRKRNERELNNEAAGIKVDVDF